MKKNNGKELILEEQQKLYHTRSEMLRYRNNKTPYMLTILSLCALVAAFCTVYGYITTVDYLTGVDILLNIVALLFSFMCAEGLKVYSKKWGVGAFVIAAWHIIHLYYPIILHSTMVGNSSVQVPVLETVRTIVVISLDLFAAALMIASGIITLVRANRLNKFLAGKDELPAKLRGAK